jgi:hypothetical protein
MKAIHSLTCSNCNVEINDNQIKAWIVEVDDKAVIEVVATCPLCYAKHTTLIHAGEMITDQGARINNHSKPIQDETITAL